jgi:gluconokinase
MSQPPLPEAEPVVLVLMGVTGSGKTTVAAHLGGRLGWDLQEGDALHPMANVAKMAAGRPLGDEDRWPWLERVDAWIRDHTRAGQPGVITCSALRRCYRDVLRRPRVVFVHLDGDRAVLASRLALRHGHHMPASLLDSQIATLEPLEPDERGIVVRLAGRAGREADEIVERLGLGHAGAVRPPD